MTEISADQLQLGYIYKGVFDEGGPYEKEIIFLIKAIEGNLFFIKEWVFLQLLGGESVISRSDRWKFYLLKPEFVSLLAPEAVRAIDEERSELLAKVNHLSHLITQINNQVISNEDQDQ